MPEKIMSQKNDAEKSKLLSAVETMTFEEALRELENIVKKLEMGKETLETAIENYEYGNALKDHCEKKLNEAQLKVDQIIKNSSNQLDTALFKGE